MCEVLADQSNPKLTKRNLAHFFKKRQYTLQHQKYKLLCRWAHHGLTSEVIERVGSEATFMYGKLEYSLESSMRRYDRLKEDDSFDHAQVKENRPRTKADLGAGSLYVENVELKPQSLIRDDDIEVYLRNTTFKNKVAKLINKFLTRLKWQPLKERFEIYEKAILQYYEQKNKSIKSQEQFVKKLIDKVKSEPLISQEKEKELEQIKESYYITQYQSQFQSSGDKIKNMWRANHDNVPDLIGNNCELKMRIVQRASLYGMKGDIEIDSGYSFSYQISVFFPTQFQKQLIKSRFSIYDAFAANDDPNQVQKQLLMGMNKIDTNIFRDISTRKETVPDDHSFNYEMRNSDIKIIRLKNSASWLKYILLKADEPDWQRKQQAQLDNDNPIDSLLAQSMNFLDLGDLPTINSILEQTAQVHWQSIKRLEHSRSQYIEKKTIQTREGDRTLQENKIEQLNMNNEAAILKSTLIETIKGEKKKQYQPNDTVTNIPKTSLKFMPSYLISAYYSLRFMQSKDAKTKVMYCLNYYRAIQRRLALDLREFGSRERVSGQQMHPYILSNETDKKIADSIKQTSEGMETTEQLLQKERELKEKSQTSRSQSQSSHRLAELIEDKSSTVFEKTQLKKINNNASMREYKMNGHYDYKLLSTCPIFPRVHLAHGEPSIHTPQYIEENLETPGKEGASEKSLKLMGRIDKIILDEEAQEVFVQDDFGIYIMYDCVLSDMHLMEQELNKIGSYYVCKQEILIDSTSQRTFPIKDRMGVVDDLLHKEAEFQFNKVKLIQAYMECYEHISDPLEQQRLMQMITDLIARRPRLNLNANYFIDSYDIDIKCLQKQFELCKILIETQMKLEKSENNRMADSLALSFHLANQYESQKWTYQNAQTFIKSVVRDRKNPGYDTKQPNKSDIQDTVIQEEDEISDLQSKKSNPDQDKSQTTEHQSNQQEAMVDDNKSEGDDQHDEFMKEYFNNEENKFTQLLGLPQISIETLYGQYKEKDENIIQIMNEQANFIMIHEGYPEFLVKKRGTQDPLIRHKYNPWSQEIGALDFYESLGFITKLIPILKNNQQELVDALKPFDNTLVAHVEIQMLEAAIAEFRRVQCFLDGSLVEYKGREYIEDEQIMGKSDKMIMFTKDVVSSLTMDPKHLLNPFLIAKMDIESIHFFDFPETKKENNRFNYYKNEEESKKTNLNKKLMTEAEFLLQMYREKRKQRTEERIELANLQMRTKLEIKREDQRNINMPSQLIFYCNICELTRLRNELILLMSETAILTEIFKQQLKECNIINMSPTFSEGISFTEYETSEKEDNINFIDEGPGKDLDIDIAVNEFDPMIRSNLNFRSPDSFKALIFTSGLEEMRAIVSYQLMQKHLLLIATRMNQLLIDTHQKALKEEQLLRVNKLLIPNSVIDAQSCVSRTSLEALDYSKLAKQKQKYSINMTSVASQYIYDITQKKSGIRTSIVREFESYKYRCSQELPKKECVQRVLRTFKIRQLNNYCNTVLMQAYFDAQKIQAIASCQNLRTYDGYFKYDSKELGIIQPGVKQTKQDDKQGFFDYETDTLLENIPFAYNLVQEKSEYDLHKDVEIKVIDTINRRIVNWQGIPSSATFVKMDSYTQQEMIDLKNQQKTLIEQRCKLTNQEYVELRRIDPNDNDIEQTLKQTLPTFTLIDLKDQTKSKDQEQQELKLKKQVSANKTKENSSQKEYEEALNFNESSYSQILKYYQMLERTFALEWFIQKLVLKQSEAVALDHSIQTGLPFWNNGERNVSKTSVIMAEKAKKDQKQSNDKNKDEDVAPQNKVLYQIVHDTVVKKKQRANIAEELTMLVNLLGKLITTISNQKENKELEFLWSYHEFRYMQIVQTLYKLIESFYARKNTFGVKAIKEAVARLTKLDHMQLHFSNNSFHVNNAFVQSHLVPLENHNIITSQYSALESKHFDHCVRPVINEKALEPSQITLFQMLYQNDPIRKGMNDTQFIGQLNSQQNLSEFPMLNTALLELTTEDRHYVQSSIVTTKHMMNDFMESIFNQRHEDNTGNDNKISPTELPSEQIFTLFELQDAKKIMEEITQAQLLKFAIIVWQENCLLPDEAKIYKEFELRYRQNFFWKVLQKKEQLMYPNGTNNQKDIDKYKIVEVDLDNLPDTKELAALKQRIKNLEDDQSLPTRKAELERDRMVKALREEFSSIKKKVTIDKYYTFKAETIVLSNEIEKNMILESVAALDYEANALANCFTKVEPTIQMHIHPFQQFAASFYDQCDKHSHLDVIHKMHSVQTFLTRLRNRGTEVQTLTSGPGMVFTVKDINECLQVFCRSMIKYSEKELKSRSESLCMKSAHYEDLIYQKDQKINNMEQRFKYFYKNLQAIIDGQLFEKTNQLVYELDTTTRQLNIYKDNIFKLEATLRKEILTEQSNKFKRKQECLNYYYEKFKDYQRSLSAMVKADFSEQEREIQQTLKKETDKYKILDDDGQFKAPNIYPGADNASGGDQRQKPQGFQHYTYCPCYKPNPKYPKPSVELADIQMMSEQEARFELARMCDQMRKQRLFWRTKETLINEKYQNEMMIMRKQLSENQSMWNQMAQCDKREKILKQEVQFLQQNLCSAEKVIYKLKDEIKKLSEEKDFVKKQQQSRSNRLRELEDKVKKQDIYGSVDTEKVLSILYQSTAKLDDQKDVIENFQRRYNAMCNNKDSKIADLQQRFYNEQVKKSDVAEMLNATKLELKMLESSDQSVAAIWKKKCQDLYEVCCSLKKENDEIREKCKDLIQSGIQLADAIKMPDSQSIAKNKHLDAIDQEESSTINIATVETTDFNNQGTISAIKLKSTQQHPNRLASLQGKHHGKSTDRILVSSGGGNANNPYDSMNSKTLSSINQQSPNQNSNYKSIQQQEGNPYQMFDQTVITTHVKILQGTKDGLTQNDSHKRAVSLLNKQSQQPYSLSRDQKERSGATSYSKKKHSSNQNSMFNNTSNTKTRVSATNLHRNDSNHQRSNDIRSILDGSSQMHAMMRSSNNVDTLSNGNLEKPIQIDKRIANKTFGMFTKQGKSMVGINQNKCEDSLFDTASKPSTADQNNRKQTATADPSINSQMSSAQYNQRRRLNNQLQGAAIIGSQMKTSKPSYQGNQSPSKTTFTQQRK